MEWLLGIIIVINSLQGLLEKCTNFFKQLKSSGSAKLSKGFEAKLSVVPIDKKSEDDHIHPHH